MRLELTRVGLLVELANHYTTRGALYLDVVAIEKEAFELPSTKVTDFTLFAQSSQRP